MRYRAWLKETTAKGEGKTVAVVIETDHTRKTPNDVIVEAQKLAAARGDRLVRVDEMLWNTWEQVWPAGGRWTE